MEHAAKAITAGDVSFETAYFFLWLDEIVAESLMISLAMGMSLELRKGLA
jgi:hypothetical protein